MATLTLTDLAIQKIKSEGKQSLYWDTNLSNFGIRIGKRAKSYVIISGNEMNRKIKTIGRYPDMSLKDARILAMSELSELATFDTSFDSKPYSDAILLFLTDARKRLKKPTVQQYAQYLKILAFQKNVGDITKVDINERLAIYDGKPYAQNYAHASLRAFFNWCLDNDYIEKHPLLRGRAFSNTK